MFRRLIGRCRQHVVEMIAPAGRTRSERHLRRFVITLVDADPPL
jgi:hypothetical protein